MKSFLLVLSLRSLWNVGTHLMFPFCICRFRVKSIFRVHGSELILNQIHTLRMPNSVHTWANESVAILSICDSLRKHRSWDGLSLNFGLSNSLVDKILIELKEPKDAKCALSFFHWSAKRANVEHTIRSYCIIVQILIKAELFEHARALLESAISKNERSDGSKFLVVESLLSTYTLTNSCPFSFDFLIQTYAKLRMFEIAFEICCYLGEHGFSPSVISFNKLIYVTQKSEKNSFVWNIYEHMLAKRTYPNSVTSRIIINAMCKEGKLKKYTDILDRIHGKKCTPLVIINTALVFRMIEEGRTGEGIQLLKRMLAREMIFDDIVHSLIIYAQFKNGNFDSSREYYEIMLKKGHSANSFVHTILIDILCKEKNIGEAHCLMQEMLCMGLKPYDETYNILVEGFSKAGRLEESWSFVEKMLEQGFLPSCSALNILVAKLCEMGSARKANTLLTTLIDKGFIPNEATYAHLIDGYGKDGDAQEVLKLYYEMEYKGQKLGLMGFTSLIKSLCQCRKLKEAEKYLSVMKEMPLTPNAYIYNALITGLCITGDVQKALLFYDEMIRDELKPSSHAFIVLVENFISAGIIEDSNIHLDGIMSSLCYI